MSRISLGEGSVLQTETVKVAMVGTRKFDEDTALA
jgi:hypothetical protein